MSGYPVARPSITPAGSWRFPAAHDFLLSNGMRVIALDLRGKQMISMQLILDVPNTDEPRGLEGIGMIAASALSCGTETKSSLDFTRSLERLGSGLAAAASATGIGVGMRASQSRLPAALALLAEGVMTPAFPGEEIERLKRTRIDSIAIQHGNPTARVLLELEARIFAPGSRAALPSGGTVESVSAIEVGAVRDYYYASIAPQTSALVVAGDLTGINLMELLETTFGAWQRTDRELSALRREPIVAGPRAVVIDRPGAVQTQLVIAATSVGLADPRLPLQQISAVALGQGLDSRLNAELREVKGYTYGFSAAVTPSHDEGLFLVQGAVQTDVTEPAVQDAMRILRDYRAGGIKQEERDSSVEQLAGRAPLQFEVSHAVAASAGRAVTQRLPLSSIDDRLDAMRASTVESIRDAFDAIDLERASIFAVGDASRIAESMKAAGLGDVEVVDS